MKTIKHISRLLIVIIVVISCNTSDEMSIQEYYVDSENNTNYLMLDIPTSIISLADDASVVAKQAYESIDKINLLAFKLSESNKENYLIEKEKVNKILKNPNYTELTRISNKGNKIVAKYLGSETKMTEVIFYASDNSKGFALARILGDDMKPENMLELLENIKDLNKDNDVFKKMEGFFGDLQ